MDDSDLAERAHGAPDRMTSTSIADASGYGVFISYNHADLTRAAWLQRRLETYRTPRALRSRGAVPATLGRVYRDATDFAAGPRLDASIRRALDASAALVVVCSPAAAASRYVNAEIEYFRSLGRAERIFPIIIEGPVPDCFPPALLVDGEPIAADARGQRGETIRAVQKLVAGILGVEHDDLVRRQEIAQRWRTRAAAALAAVFAGLALFSTLSALAARTSEHQAVAAGGRARLAQTEAERQRDLAVAARRREAEQRSRADRAALEAQAQRSDALKQRDAARAAEARANVALAGLQADRQDWSSAREIAAKSLARGGADVADKRRAEAILVQAATSNRELEVIRLKLPLPTETDADYLENVVFDDRAEVMVTYIDPSAYVVRVRDGEVLASYPEVSSLFGLAYDPAARTFVGGASELLCLRAPDYKLSSCAPGVRVPRGRTSTGRADGAGALVKLPDGRTSHVPLPPDGSIEISANSDYALEGTLQTLTVWRLSSPEAQVVFESNITKHRVLHPLFAVSRDSHWAALSPGIGDIVLLDLTHKTQQPLIGHKDYVEGLAFDEQHDTLVSYGKDRTLRRWRLGPPKSDWRLTLPQVVHAAALDRSGTVYAAATSDGVHFGDTAGRSAESVPLSASLIRRLAVAKGVAVAGQTDGTLTRIDLRTGKAFRLAGHQGAVLSLALEGSGRRLISGGADDVAIVQDLDTGAVLCRIKFETHAQVVAFPTSGSDVFLTATGALIQVWGVQGCEKRDAFHLDADDAISAVDYDAVTGRLLVGDLGGDVFVGDPRQRTLKRVGRVPLAVSAVSLKDGGVVVSADGTVRSIDLAGRALLNPFLVADGNIEGAAIAQSASTLLTWRGRELVLKPLTTNPQALMSPARVWAAAPRRRPPRPPPRAPSSKAR